MLYKKGGFPEEGEILLCTVKKVLYNSIFVDLDEYKNKEGMIHISEIAPGRIRNIRDYVKEGKTIVCKVLVVDPANNRVDLSLRRVGSSLTREKLIEKKQEERVEKILDFVGKKEKKTIEEMYTLCGDKIIEKYGSLYAGFQDIFIKGETVLNELGIPKEISKSLIEIIKQKIRPPEVEVTAALELRSYASNGIDIIKSTLTGVVNKFEDKGYKMKLRYISAPRYELVINASDYKTAEKELVEIGT